MSNLDLKTKTRLLMGELLDRVLSGIAPAHPASPARALDLSELEERILLSASPAAVMVESANAAPTDLMAEESVLIDSSVQSSSQTQTSSSVEQSNSNISTSPSQDVSREIVFLDTSVDDYLQLLDDLWSNDDPGREIEVVLLSGSRDGIEQISEALAGRSDLDAVHIVSHGTDATVKLGSTWLTQDNLPGYVGDIARWGSSLSIEADLLFYGCDLAASADGQQLIESISMLTGADVAASDDATGHAILGADWELEYAAGQIEAQVVFSQNIQANWLHSLDVATFQEGVASYTGTEDTEIREIAPDTSYGAITTIAVDINTPGDVQQGLLQFANLFGTGPGQIPVGATINTASLTVEAINASSSGAQITLHRMLTTWSETSTWNSLTGGVTNDGVEAAVAADSTLASPDVIGQKTFSGLEATLQAWSDGATNNGWAILNDNGDGWDFNSSEHATASLRPVLNVTYTASTDPVISLPGAAVNYTENDPATVIDGSATASDADSTDFDTGSLTVDFTANGEANDRLAIRNEGTGAGQIGVSGANVTYAGVTIGTFSGGTNGTTPLVITFNASSTPTSAQALMRNITFENVSDNPGTAARTVRFVLADGLGGISTAVTETINVTAENDVPATTTTGSALAYTENDIGTNIDTGLTVADPDSSIVSATVQITTGYDSAQDLLSVDDRLGITGSYDSGTGILTLTGTTTVANYQNVLRTVKYQNVSDDPTASRVISFTVNDGTVNSNTSTRTVNITSVNDAPVVATTTGTLAFTENDPATAIDAALTVTDADTTITDGTVTISANFATGEDVLAFTNQLGISGSYDSGTGVLTLTGTTSAANYQTALRTITYQNTSDDPSTLTREITFALSDGTDTSIAGIQTSLLSSDFSVDADGFVYVDDAFGTADPAKADGVYSGTVGKTGGGLLVTVGPGANTADVSGGFSKDFTLTEAGDVLVTLDFRMLMGEGYETDEYGEVVLTIDGTRYGSDTNTSLLHVIGNKNGGGVEDSGWLSGEVRVSLGAGVHTLTIGAYNNKATAGDEFVEVAFDNVVVGEVSSDKLVTVAAENDASTISLPGAALAYTENDAATVIDATATAADADSADLDTGTLTIDFTANGTANDRLAIRNEGTGAGQIGVSGSNVTYAGVTIGTFAGGTDGSTPLVITLNANSTPTSAQALMRNITFENVSAAPSELARTVRFVLTDGDGGTSTAATQTINVDNLGGEPTQNVPGAQNVDEDATLTFNIANGNAVSVSDNGPDDAQLQVFLSVNDGILTLSQTTGLSIPDGADGSAFMTIHGTESDINAALEGLVFTPDSDFNGAVNLQVTTSLGASLDGHYTFDAFDATDDSAGTPQNGTLLGGVATVTDGTRGEVLSLDGSNDTVRINSLFSQPASVTLAGWVNLNVAAGNDQLFTLGNVFGLELHSTLGVSAFFYDGATINSTTSGVLLDGTGWHHVAYTVDDIAGTQTIYIDGAAVATTSHATTADYATSNAETYIGSNKNSSKFFNGLVDEARIYTRALSADEVANLAVDNTSVSGNVSITVNAINDAAVLDLDADDSRQPGSAYLATFSGSPVLIADADASLNDIDSANLTSLTVTINNLLDGASEVLAADTSGTSIGASYAGGVLSLTGSDTVANYQQVLRTVTYDNTSTAPDSTARTVQFVANDGTDDSIPAFTTVNFGASLWLSTSGDVISPSGAPGLDSWSNSEALEFGGPGLTLESGATSGTFSSKFDIDNFTTGANVTAMHFVTRSLTLGTTTTFDVQGGDLLLSLDTNETLTGTNTLAVESKDIVLFRPNEPGVYTQGSFYIILDNPTGTNLSAVSLVEADTTVGGVNLLAGEFLLANSGDSDIYHYTADEVGLSTTSGVTSTLIDGSDINFSSGIAGLELIEEPITLGDVTLSTGQLLVTLAADDATVGGNAIAAASEDIFFLDVTTAGTTTVANATLLFEGADVGLNSTEEGLDSIALVTNLAPLTGADAYNVIAQTPLVVDAADGVLSNDGDPNGNAVSLTLVSDVSDGMLSLNGDGSFTYTPDPGFVGTDSFTYRVNDGVFDSTTATVTLVVRTPVTANSFILATEGDVGSPSGAPGLDSWSAGSVLEFSDPTFALEPGVTSGTFSSLTSLDTLAVDGDTTINAVHRVSRDITIGGDLAPAIDLFTGDLLLVMKDSEDLTSTNSLAVTKQDLFVFRPDTPGDYSAGTFTLLLQDVSGTGAEIRGITLVEQNTAVGDTILQAGTFLFTTGGGGTENLVQMFVVDDVGAGTTSGTRSIFIDGDDVGITAKILAVELLEQRTTIADTTLDAGYILISVDNSANVGDNNLSVARQDVFYLDVTSPTVASATLLLEGLDVGLDTNNESISGLSMVFQSAPVISLPGGALNFTENDPATVIDATATAIDADSSNLDTGNLTIDFTANGTANDRLAIQNEGTGIGQIGVSGSDVTYNFGAGAVTIATFAGGTDGSTPLVITFNATSTPVAAQALMRNITYQNVATDPDTNARTVRFVLADGDGGTSNAATQTINLSGDNRLFVTTTADTADGVTTSINALLADRGADGKISLREAILATNATANGGSPDEIYFNISLSDAGHFYYQDNGAAGFSAPVSTTLADGAITDFDADYPAGMARSWYTIALASALPNITEAVTLDASTQMGYTDGAPVIELDGSAVAGSVDGLTIATNNATVRGLVINQFSQDGIEITGDGNLIAGNFIGTDVSGTVDRGVTFYGISIDGASSNNTIGGITLADRNLISGNNGYGIEIGDVGSDDNIVIGNYIGTDVTGTVALGNTNAGVYIENSSTGNRIGGTTAAERNVISGNNGDGIFITGAGTTTNLIQGNYIGTNAAGTGALGNLGDGISIQNAAPSTTIGGSATGAGNIIAANTGYGINIISAVNTTIQGNTIGSGVNGTEDLGNSLSGVRLIGPASSNTLIGGLNAGEGNLIAFNLQRGIETAGTGGDDRIEGNIIHDQDLSGILSFRSGTSIVGNFVYSNSTTAAFDEVVIGNDHTVYHNTIHASPGDGISVEGTGAVIQNNIITGSAGFGIRVDGGTITTESYNLITDAVTGPANLGGQANFTVDATTLNADPQYTNAAAGDFSLVDPTSPAIDAGIDLGVNQPDMNGATAGNFNGAAPDIGASESAYNNAGPAISLPGAALSYTENDAATVIDATATASDADSADLDTGTLTIDFTANSTSNDRLSINNEGTGAGQIGVSGSNVTYAGVTIGTFAGGTDGSTPLVITLNANSTPTSAQALMRNITFENVSDDPSTAARTVRFVLTDGDGGTSNAATQTINLTAENDASTISLPGAALAYTENDAATVIDATATATDVDSADFDTGTLTIDFTANGTANDRLAIRNEGTGAGQIGVSGSNVSYEGTTIGTFTGGTSGGDPLVITFNANSTPAAAQALMRNITFENVSENPSAAARTVRFVLTDGDGGTSNAATQTVNFTAVNDAPVAVADSYSVNEDTSLVVPLATGVLDNDTDPENDTLTAILVTDVSDGALSLSADGSFTYTPDADFHGTDSFTYKANDSALDSNTVTVTITVNPVAGITVTPTSGLITSEAGVADTFDVVLESRPDDVVTIGISSSDTGEGTVSTTGISVTRSSPQQRPAPTPTTTVSTPTTSS